MLFNCYMGIMYVTECTPVKNNNIKLSDKCF